jgi:lysophospholipase L1-like esterase
MKTILLIFLLSMFAFETLQAQDWANLSRYQEENETLGLPAKGEKRVVFMGNSITESWSEFSPDFFNENKYINRGISGQTTPQMLVRFRPDVINLKPALVLILAGTNDIAGNTGPMTQQMIEDNIYSMVELAKQNKIRVILCSVLPAADYPWKPGLNPAQKIAGLNQSLKKYAEQNRIYYLDYYSSMVDDKGGLQQEYTYDGVHPNEKGYEVMEKLAKEAIRKVLK